ncbi:DNA ligase [Tepidibacillus infernus]|uniref:ATP-dependent DNA ligase n=1 Tax=Tepidibacillus infernus TaxID=1806172 RepID=UPI003B75320C
MEFKPIVPFEPTITKEIPTGDKWIAQIKWDGVRILSYFNGHHVKLFNRKLNERTNHYPELIDIQTYCNVNSVILDGEVIALGNDGKPSFHEIMKRDGIRRLDKIKRMQNIVPITYMIFDILYLNGEWINSWPLKKRIKALSAIIKPNPTIQLVSSHHDGKELFNVVVQHQMEGIVVKNLNSSYIINGKDSRWQKIKNYQDLIAVVGGVTLREGIVNAILLGLYDQEGQLWYIGHAGTGKLTHTDWRSFTKKVKEHVQKERPFINKPERMNEVIWIRPQITVKVKFMEWTENQTLRQPSIQGFVDHPKDECTF